MQAGAKNAGANSGGEGKERIGKVDEMIEKFILTVEPWYPDRNNAMVLKYKIEKWRKDNLFYERVITLEMLEQEGWFDIMLREAGKQLKRQLIESEG